MPLTDQFYEYSNTIREYTDMNKPIPKGLRVMRARFTCAMVVFQVRKSDLFTEKEKDACAV